MKVEMEDVLFWMDAIRNCDDRYRTLESFWKGQVRSKIWLIDCLEKIANIQEPVNIDIYGGWNGVLASLMFNSNIPIKHITSVDIDPLCEETAYTMNKRYEIDGRFTAITANMCNYASDADIVINTSCEHITQEQHDKWLTQVSHDSLIVLQSNNYYELDEHIRCAEDMSQFIKQSNIEVQQYSSFPLEKYTRFMIIGKKYG